MLQRLQLIPFAKYVTYTYKVVVYLKEIDILHVGELGCCETITRYLHTYIHTGTPTNYIVQGTLIKGLWVVISN